MNMKAEMSVHHFFVFCRCVLSGVLARPPSSLMKKRGPCVCWVEISVCSAPSQLPEFFPHAASLSSFKWSAWRIGSSLRYLRISRTTEQPGKLLQWVSEGVEHQCNLLKELVSMSAYHDDTLENWYSANRTLNLDVHERVLVTDVHTHRNGFFLINYLQMVLFHI